MTTPPERRVGDDDPDPAEVGHDGEGIFVGDVITDVHREDRPVRLLRDLFVLLWFTRGTRGDEWVGGNTAGPATAGLFLYIRMTAYKLRNEAAGAPALVTIRPPCPCASQPMGAARRPSYRSSDEASASRRRAAADTI